MKLSVNRAVVNKSKDWEILATRFVNEELTLDQLALEVNAGHAFSTQHKGRRKQENFIAGGYIALDFDRNNPGDIDEILMIRLFQVITVFFITHFLAPQKHRNLE
jgi:hypothetical protein